MSLLKEFEGEQLEPVDLVRSDTASPLVDAEGEESFQIHRPKEKKDKRSRLSEDGKKLSSLSLRKGKQKEGGGDKTPRRGRHVRSKSGSRTPPDSPKAGRAADTVRKGSKATVGQLQPSPNVKSSRKRYAVLGQDTVSSDSDSEEENGLMVSNQAAEERTHQPDTREDHAPTSPSTVMAPPTSSSHFPVPFSPLEAASERSEPHTLEATSERPVPHPLEGPSERLGPHELPAAPFAFQNPLSQDISSPSHHSGGSHHFFMSPMPAPPLQPVASSLATAPPPPSQAADSDWTISGELRTKCARQFAELCPEDGLLSGDRARAFFIQSRLPNQELSQIWRLSDMDKDNALSEQEFCVAMKLVLMRRRGNAIPSSLPEGLRPAVQEGPFTDSFVPAPQPPVQGIPPPPQQASHRHRHPKATQSALELPPPSQPEPVETAVSREPPSLFAQQSAPELLKVEDSEDSHVTNPIYVEVNDKSTSDVGPLMGNEEVEEEEGEKEVVSEPPVARIISYEPASGSEEGEENGESATFFQVRRRTSSEGSAKPPPQQHRMAPPTKPATVGRSKSLRQAPPPPDQPPRTAVGHQDVPDTHSAAGETEGEEAKPTARRSSRPAKQVTKAKYQSIEQGGSPPSSPDRREEEEEDGEGRRNSKTGFTRLKPTAGSSKRGHARSTSLDLKKMVLPTSDVVADVPPAVPPPPPPKPHQTPSPSEEVKREEKPVFRGRSASTGSISSSGPPPAVVPERRSVTPEDHSMDTSTDMLLNQKSPPPTKPRQPAKKQAPLFPPKPRRPPAPTKPPKQDAEPEVTEQVKPQTLEERPLRSKSQLQVTIRSLKETNATLSAINKGLEEKLFMLMEERVKLSRELELAQAAQTQHH